MKKIIFFDSDIEFLELATKEFKKNLNTYEIIYEEYPSFEKALEHPSLIITNLNFPGSNKYQGNLYGGFELYGYVKKINPETPIIINTNIPLQINRDLKDKKITEFTKKTLHENDAFYTPKKSGSELLEIIHTKYGIY
jgi:hypothetical protein